MSSARSALVCSLVAASLHAQGSVSGKEPPFADLRRTVPSLEDVGPLAFADLDGDGAPELILGAIRQAQILFNDGDGGLRGLENPLAPFGLAGAPFGGPAAAGDLDGDGHVDVLFGSSPRFGDGTGRLQAVAVPVPAFIVRDAILVDVDGDGDLDPLFGDGYRTVLLRNEGARTFADASGQIPAGGVDAVLLALDADGDGDQDIVRDAVLLRNDGSGQFREDTAAIPAAPFGTAYRPFEAADIDLDGDVDLVAADLSGELVLLSNQGDGSFVARTFAPAVSVDDSTNRPFSLADFDGDGDPDLLSVAPPFLLENDGTGVFADASAGLPAALSLPSAQHLAGDVDRDGDLDVLWLCPNSGYAPLPLGLWLGDGEGGFLEVQRHVPPVRYLTLALADVDGDGDLDQLGQPAFRFLAGPVSSPVRRNDGSGVFEPAPELFGRIPQPVQGARDVAAGDVDDDGDVDLLWSGFEKLLYVSEGASGFVDRSAELLPVLGTAEARAALFLDADADGDLDAFLSAGAPTGSGPVGVLLHNDGTGRFSDASGLLPPRREFGFAADHGDVDGDGTLDLVLGNLGQNALFLGDGAGGFVDGTAAWLPLEGSSDLTYDLALDDLDGDGDLDLYAANASVSTGPYYEGGHFPRSDQVLLNEGDALRERTELHRTQDVGYQVELFDADGDGDVDALVGTASYVAASMIRGGETFLYLNQGDGRLVLDPSVVGRLELELASGDVDQDGDVDVVCPDRVLTNIQRALAWHGLPRVERVLRLEVYGPAHAPFQLLMGDATAALATDAGLLRLDPGSIGLIVQGRLGPHGRDAVEFLPPASLLGQTLYWQALLGAPGSFALTNLEPTTFFGN